jgi:RES domain-containing protein
MTVYRISPCKYIMQLTGYGAFLNGGRWNSKDKFMLYSSYSPALAMLETLAHFSAHYAPDNYCIIALEVPNHLIGELQTKDLPKDWQVSPGPTALQQIGDHFLDSQQFVGLKVPSSIIDLDFNLLLNPQHPFFYKIKIVHQASFSFDKRVLQLSD